MGPKFLRYAIFEIVPLHGFITILNYVHHTFWTQIQCISRPKRSKIHSIIGLTVDKFKKHTQTHFQVKTDGNMGSPMYAEVVSSGDDVEILPKPELSLQERLSNLDRQLKKKKPYFQVKTDYEKVY